MICEEHWKKNYFFCLMFWPIFGLVKISSFRKSNRIVKWFNSFIKVTRPVIRPSLLGWEMYVSEASFSLMIQFRLELFTLQVRSELNTEQDSGNRVLVRRHYMVHDRVGRVLDVPTVGLPRGGRGVRCATSDRPWKTPLCDSIWHKKCRPSGIWAVKFDIKGAAIVKYQNGAKWLL